MHGKFAILFTGLLFVAGAQTPAPMPSSGSAQTPAEQQTADEQILKNAGLKTDGPDLLQFFRQRVLPESERPRIRALIRQLGSESYIEREQAMTEIVSRGPVVMEMLREAMKDPDSEISRRAERGLARIQEKDLAIEVPAAAARLLGLRKPPEAVEVLLAYLPFADNDSVIEQVRDVLSLLAVTDGKLSPILVKALEDKTPLRRAIAGEALSKAALPGGGAEQKAAVRKLLHDEDPGVRLRIGLMLAMAKDPAAIPALIDVLQHLPLTQAWQAEDILFRLAEGKTPPDVSLGQDEASRKKCRDAWHAWWEKEGAKIDLAKLSDTPRLLGYTVVVLLDEGRVMELGANKETRWQIGNLLFPLDVQILPDDHVLIAEYHASRVAERNTKGEIIWQKRIEGPLCAQRLANGNTFIATESQFMEFDRDDKQVLSVVMPNGERIMKAQKLPNGEIACLTSEARIVRMNAAGKELHSFTIDLGARLFGGRLHMLPSGRVLVPHNGENKVVEYDANGKSVWEVSVDQPIAAVRLPNGNTLVTSMLPGRGAVEFDRAGREVWTFRAPTRVTRAVRR